MKSLMCVVVGDGSVFVVDLADHNTVGHLKRLIKREKPSTITCEADHLSLYLAKKAGGDWLKTTDPEMKMVANGEFPQQIHEIMKRNENRMDDATFRMDNPVFNFPLAGCQNEGEIRVLVAAPGALQPQAGSDGGARQPHPIRKRRWEQLNRVLILAEEYEQAAKPIVDDSINLLHAYLCVVTKAFGEVVTGTEAKRLHLVAPVLACVCARFDRDVQILADETVVGKRVHGVGRFEFVIKRGSKRVCIVEAKQNDLQQGLAQAYVGSEVLADVEGLPSMYNIVTTYMDWCVSRILEDRVERHYAVIDFGSHSIPTRESVKKIAEKIYSMLSEDNH